MATEEHEAITMIKKYLTRKGKIVKKGETLSSPLKISDGGEYRPDIFTIDKDNVIDEIYEVIIKLDEDKIKRFSNLSKMAKVSFVIPVELNSSLQEILKKNSIKDIDVLTYAIPKRSLVK